MRWFVEVAPSNKPEASEKWVVEAAQWQPALQAARTLRGEAVEMSGFSIELLEDGFRAVDPNTFVRYVVRRAPDGTPVSNPQSMPSAPPRARKNGGSSPPAASGGSASQPPVAKAARIAAMLDIGASRPASPPVASTAVASARPEAAKTTPSTPPPKADAPLQGRATSQVPRSWSQSGPPRPGAPRPASQPPPAAAARTSSPDLARTSSPDLARTSSPDLARAAATDGARRSAPDLAQPGAQSSARASVPDALPPAELLFQREEDPSAASPLTYRETVWVVPPGTSSDAAVRLLVGMFEGVRAALAGAKPGKLVNMAIFDHRFQGKPQAPPLATLTWKDWKDQGQGPEIRRAGDPPVSMLPSAYRSASEPPPSAGGNVPIAPAPVLVPPPMVAAPPAPVPPAASVAAPPVSAAPAVVAPGSVPPPAMVAPPEVVPIPAPPVAAAPVQAPPPAEVPAPSAEPLARTQTPSVPRIRLSGVELITDLFEAMHELHFLRDSIEGADFVLSLVMDKLPSSVGLVHFYDIDAREFVVVRTVGPGAAKALQIRTNEKEPLIAEAMRSRRAVVIDDATNDPRAQNGRWALIGSCRSLVCAPVEQGGRFLGLLEISNPRDGGPFHETDGHALTYMGEQFAEFLATRGLVLDPDRIGR